MSVSVTPAKRLPFAAGDLMGGTVEEKVAAAESYIAYAGRYDLQGEDLVVQPEVAFFPNWIGVAQIRRCELDGDRLTLSTPPMLLQGREQTAHLVWDRV